MVYDGSLISTGVLIKQREKEYLAVHPGDHLGNDDLVDIFYLRPEEHIVRGRLHRHQHKDYFDASNPGCRCTGFLTYGACRARNRAMAVGCGR